MVVMVVLVVSFAGQVIWAEEKPVLLENEAKFQNVLIALDKLEKGCPYSFSEELILSDMLENMIKGFDALASSSSSSKEDVSWALVVKVRMEEILTGPCCQITRSFKEVQEMLFDLQKGLKTPSNRKWWEGLDSEDWQK